MFKGTTSSWYLLPLSPLIREARFSPCLSSNIFKL
jgi:hypothetical protein